MKKVGESSCDGHLTNFESLLLKAIIIHCIINGIQVSPLNIFSMYTQIFTTAEQCTLIQFPTFNRNEHHIKQVLVTMQLLVVRTV